MMMSNFLRKFWIMINDSIFRLILILSFLGVVPVLLFMYYNLINFDGIKVIISCATLLTLIKLKKAIQG